MLRAASGAYVTNLVLRTAGPPSVVTPGGAPAGGRRRRMASRSRH